MGWLGWLGCVVGRPKHGFAVRVDTWVDRSFTNVRATLLDSGSGLPEYLNPRVYEPWVHGFCSDSASPGLPGADLYQRVVMLLGLDLALRKNAQPH